VPAFDLEGISRHGRIATAAELQHRLLLGLSLTSMLSCVFTCLPMCRTLLLSLYLHNMQSSC
jgi:hypothetical protein